MQSTTTVFCRAFVMIFCLVTIPLAALFGTSLSDIAKMVGFGQSVDPVREECGEAPLFTANIPGAAESPDYPAAGLQPSDAQPAVNNGNAFQGGSVPPTAQPPKFPTAQASFNEPAPLYDGSTVAVNPGQSQEDIKRPDQRPIVPVPAGNLGAMGGRFEAIQERLQTLGASYFRLESFGSAGQFYRFQCEVPIGGDGAVRHFEATSINALEAMDSVLAEVDRWMKNE